MKRNKIILDDNFSVEESGKKDFNRLLTAYNQKQALIKLTKWIAGSIAFFALVLLGIFFYPSSASLPESTKSSTEVAAEPVQELKALEISKEQIHKVQPPFQDVDFAFEKKQIRASRRETFITSKGTIMEIPAGAFADTGYIEVHYREFYDVSEVLAGGVTADYDSSGQVYPFESAGMIEVKGYIGKKELLLKKGKKIKIKLRSRKRSKDYSVYCFDKGLGKWTYRGKDQVIVKSIVSEDDTTGINIESDGKMVSIQLLKKEKMLQSFTAPVRLKPADKDAYNFIYRINPDEFPELYGYKDLRFEIAASEKDMVRQINNEQWDKIELHRNLPEDNYIAVLSNSTTRKSVVVHPVYTGDPGPLEKVYNEKMNEYLTKKKTLEKQIERLKIEEKDFERKQKKQLKKAEQKSAEKVLYRMFEIDQTGIWNISRISDWSPQKAKAFIGTKHCSGTIFLVDVEKNGVYKFEAADGEIMDFKIPVSKKFYLIHIEKGNKIYLIRQKEYSVEKNHTLIFQFFQVPEEIKSVSDLKRMLI